MHGPATSDEPCSSGGGLEPSGDTHTRRRRATRWLLAGIGVLCVALGVIGVVLPLLPTTPFLLVAAWAFARSSPRFQHWLVTHRVLGPYVNEWRTYGIVPVRAKALAIVMMSASFAWMAFLSNVPAVAVAVAGFVLACVALFLLTRPSTRPAVAVSCATPPRNSRRDAP